MIHSDKDLDCMGRKADGEKPKIKVYKGARLASGTTAVVVDDQPLDPRLDLYNHSPGGFEWGYGGSGPAQLALAILAHHLDDDSLATNLHHAFKFYVIGGFKKDRWQITSAEIEKFLRDLRAGKMS